MDLDLSVNVLHLMGAYLEMEQQQKRAGIDRILKMRSSRGQFFTLFNELEQNPAKFWEYTRMSLPVFEKLLEMLRPR